VQNVSDEGKDWPKPSPPVISDTGAGALPSHEAIWDGWWATALFVVAVNAVRIAGGAL
jgi:hypothetical protein